MIGSRYVSDPEIWRKFYRNMLNGNFNLEKYSGHQTGGGIAGMYSKKPYMIPVNPHATLEEKPVTEKKGHASGCRNRKGQVRIKRCC